MIQVARVRPDSAGAYRCAGWENGVVAWKLWGERIKRKKNMAGRHHQVVKAERQSKSLHSFAATVALGAAMAEPRDSQAGGLKAQPLSLGF